MDAFLLRLLGSHREGGGNMRKVQHFDTIVPREDKPELKTCIKHPRACKYEGKECPACAAEKEFLNLTEI